MIRGLSERQEKAHFYFVTFIFTNGEISTRKLLSHMDILAATDYVHTCILQERAKHDGLARAIDFVVVEERTETMMA
jgi:hypothetical protein